MVELLYCGRFVRSDAAVVRSCCAGAYPVWDWLMPWFCASVSGCTTEPVYGVKDWLPICSPRFNAWVVAACVPGDWEVEEVELLPLLLALIPAAPRAPTAPMAAPQGRLTR